MNIRRTGYYANFQADKKIIKKANENNNLQVALVIVSAILLLIVTGFAN